MALSQNQLKVLEPWLERKGPNEDGEWGLHCPFHQDRKRSASLNVETGLFYCQACDRGVTARELLKAIRNGDYTNDPSKASSGSSGGSSGGERLSDARVAGWTGALLADEDVLGAFQDRRGIDRDIIETYEIGWDSSSSAYTIPIRDADGSLVNVRRYSLDPGDRRKIWSVSGHGTPVLYPIGDHKGWGDDGVIICEGEFDTLLTIQQGFDAVTRTGAAKVWRGEWNHYFKDLDVYLCHDMDEVGQEANHRVAMELVSIAKSVRIIELPYEVTDKHGKDLTDFWLEGNAYDDLRSLMDGAVNLESGEVFEREVRLEDISVMDSFDPDRVGQHLRMRITVVGKRQNNFIVPRTVEYSCKKDAKATECAVCPMREEELDGSATIEVDPKDPLLLQFMGSSANQVTELLRNLLGARKCGKMKTEVSKYHSVEEIWARPAIESGELDTAREDLGGYQGRRMIAVNKHDTMPNNTFQVTGAIYPNPRSQANEFQMWDINPLATNVDQFVLDDKAKSLLRKFQVSGSQTPYRKAMSIAHDLSEHVTKIYGREELHMFLDLIWHSVIAFNFERKLVHKGWVEGLVIGDTRTGKSEVAQFLTRHYGSGEFVRGESASFAGVVGGLQQVGNKEWVVTWGAIPLNDRRMVILDEVSGLKPQEIGQMSSIRSDGEAQITKIQSEKTQARTRLAWLGNPRDGLRMQDFTYGVQAIRPLIGANEDIARFDMAMMLSEYDVSPDVMTRDEDYEPDVKHRYTREACHTLINWVWTRTPDQVIWGKGAEHAVIVAARDLGSRYVPDPPLIQAANVRLKLARISVAFAARVCSTDDTFENIVVLPEHVQAAVTFLDHVYGNPHFGYKDLSEEQVRDREIATEMVEDVRAYLQASDKEGLAKFLRSCAGHFRRTDLEDMLNWSREEATATINLLYQKRMIRREGANNKINPELHTLLRELTQEEE